MPQRFLPTTVTTLVVACATAACESSKSVLPTPAATDPPNIAATLAVTSVKIAGTAAFETIGQTSQFTATASFVDGTTKNVTSEAVWSSLNSAVVSVTSTGLATITGFGSATVQAVYQTRSGFFSVSATPAGTVVGHGRVREPGRSGVGGVQVVETRSGSSAQTGSQGEFAIAGLPIGTRAHYTFEKAGYEPAEIEEQVGTGVEVPLQQIIRVATGESVSPLQLAPHDLAYTVGSERCYPCRLVRVSAPGPGTLQLQLRWATAKATLHIWAAGQRFAGTAPEARAEIPVSGGEIVVFVGMLLPSSAEGADDYVPFNLAATLR